MKLRNWIVFMKFSVQKNVFDIILSDNNFKLKDN